ncbi:PASTA domain-containing protein [Sanyastnella coralliicola]|uniref:PASTA domain-containing protein n=1 Tax=Sanyastnella coralliicola TaxID=3069118 RepID=UPI0027B9A3C1|nr:PASTA domain-containing protein [Longitalea sp. SCSIO 12813]
MEFLKFIFSKTFAKNLIFALIFVVLVPLGLYMYLSWSTEHGEHVDVPDLTGMQIADAASKLDELSLTYVVIDSVYSEKGERGAIFEQSPPAEAEVKEGRLVYLTVYRLTPPAETLKVEEGMNERVAEIILDNKGIRYEKEYVEDQLLAGMVVKVVRKGKELEPDAQIRRGERVTLVIGKLGDERVNMPSLKGMTLDSAEIALNNARLTLGSTLYDSTVLTESDSAMARVYRQSPTADGKQGVQVGSLVDLFLGIRAIEPDSTIAP